MLKHILIPIDLSERNERTLRIGGSVARTGARRVTLLHVIHRVPNLPVRELHGFYEKLARRSRQALARAARRFVNGDFVVRTRVVIGDPAGEIIKAARTREVDLIVMGSHRVKPGRPGHGIGTTSYKVAIACPCPILLVK